MNHYTDKDGFNGIRSQPTWLFWAVQPRAQHHPAGAYFTTLEPNEPNLSKKLMVPREKLERIFEFDPPTPLEQLPGKRGKAHQLFYSPTDYSVPRTHQIYCGDTEEYVRQRGSK